MGYLDFAAFEKAMEEPVAPRAFAGARAPQKRTDLPRWLVDPEFDASMEALSPAADAAGDRLPWATRMGVILSLAVLSWVPLVVVGVVLWF